MSPSHLSPLGPVSPLGNDTLERWGFRLLAASLGVVQFKIGPAQILFGLAAICWLVLAVRNREPLSLPAWSLPLGLYAVLTLASAAMSLDPFRSFVDSRQLLLFLMVPVVARLARGARAVQILDVVMALGAAGALVGIVEAAILGYDTLNNRPTGMLSHYMTYSGVLMLVTCVAAARLLFERERRLWPAVAVPALLSALALTLTLNAYIGTALALAVLLAVRNPRLLLVLPVALVIGALVAPAQVRGRVMSGFSPDTESNRDRLQMIAMGLDIVRDYPLFGVGPEMVGDVYGKYLRPNPVHTYNPHLHDVPVQIAAERGIPALVAWLAFVALVIRACWRQLRRGPARDVAGAGLAATVAMLSAGLFEYNFGDSEFLMLYLGLITLPFAATFGAAEPAAGVPVPVGTGPVTPPLAAKATWE